MANFKRLFMEHMDSEGIKYTDVKDYVVKVVYNGDNLDSIPVYVFFDEDGDPMVQFKCWNILNFEGNEAKGILACNEMNKKFRWVKFYLDKDADIVADTDAYIDEFTCGSECLSLVRRVVSIVDDAYPTFAKAKWA